MVLGLGLLQAKYIWGHVFKIGKEILLGNSTNAVYIPRYEFHC